MAFRDISQYPKIHNPMGLQEGLIELYWRRLVA